MHEFLPCTYGYATTIRRAQGASLDYVCLNFDAKKASDLRYGYVGASRCRSAAGLFYYKRIRRTDWLPHGEGDEGECVWHEDSDELESYEESDSNNSEWSHLLSDCPQPSSDEDLEFDENGNLRTIEGDPSKGDHEFEIVAGAEVEDNASYLDFGAFKRRRLNDDGFA